MSYSELYNGVVQYDTVDTTRVVCDLCASWDTSNGGQTMTFKIRDGIKWQDGEDLTAEDVVSGLTRYMDPDVSIGRSGLFRNYVKSVGDGGIKVVDDLTMEFNLSFASGAFIKFLALDYAKVLPTHILDKGIDLNQAENVIASSSGSGPFVLEEYQRGNFYSVSKNPNYFKEGRPFFDAITHFIIVDSGTIIAQFKGGQLDMADSAQSNLTPTENMELDKDTLGSRNGHVISYVVSPSFNVMLMVNRKAEPFNDIRVRKAIYLAMDRQQINDLLQDNTAAIPCPMMGMGYTFDECATWPGLRPKDTPGGQADIAEAKRLMAEAGFPDGFATSYDARQVANYPDVCSVVKQQLKETLGITGDLQTWESAAGYAMYGESRPEDSTGDWELGCQGEGMTVIDADGLLGGVYIKGATRNYTDWETPAIREQFEAQKVEQDVDQRRDILKEMEEYLVFTDPDDYSKGFVDNHTNTLYWGKFFWIVHEDIKGFNPPQSVQNVFKHEDIWLDR
jgi:peptide/nickel transport system substrate-binding protein